MNKKKNNKKVFIILGIVLVILISFSIIFHNTYMENVETTFSNVKDTVKTSNILNDKYGTIKEVKFNNFMKWITKKDNYDCIEMKIVTDKQTKNICTIINYEDSISMYLVNGYEVDGSVLND